MAEPAKRREGPDRVTLVAFGRMRRRADSRWSRSSWREWLQDERITWAFAARLGPGVDGRLPRRAPPAGRKAGRRGRPGTIRAMIGHEPPLRLDAPREEVLEHAVKLVAEAWQSFDRYRPEEPPLDERVRAAPADRAPDRPRLRPRGGRRRRADPRRVDRAAPAPIFRRRRFERARDRHDRRTCSRTRTTSTSRSTRGRRR